MATPTHFKIAGADTDAVPDSLHLKYIGAYTHISSANIGIALALADDEAGSSPIPKGTVIFVRNDDDDANYEYPFVVGSFFTDEGHVVYNLTLALNRIQDMDTVLGLAYQYSIAKEGNVLADYNTRVISFTTRRDVPDADEDHTIRIGLEFGVVSLDDETPEPESLDFTIEVNWGDGVIETRNVEGGFIALDDKQYSAKGTYLIAIRIPIKPITGVTIGLTVLNLATTDDHIQNVINIDDLSSHPIMSMLDLIGVGTVEQLPNLPTHEHLTILFVQNTGLQYINAVPPHVATLNATNNRFTLNAVERILQMVKDGSVNGGSLNLNPLAGGNFLKANMSATAQANYTTLVTAPRSWSITGITP